MTNESKDQGRRKVLFLCFHNSARSQMAEGLLRAMCGDKYEVFSAGIEATHVDPRAVKAMSEVGIDISCQRSKGMDELRGILFDLAVTVCDKAKEACPICGVSIHAQAATPAARKTVHRTFKDPASARGSEEDQLNAFRQVRDEIKEWIYQAFVISQP
ncbi:MAG TPA: arsenate reductase ArsC [Methanotrichaceae archaeon]|nr:arsenate reductase ArsC [Methanotrichaceae archaeon]